MSVLTTLSKTTWNIDLESARCHINDDQSRVWHDWPCGSDIMVLSSASVPGGHWTFLKVIGMDPRGQWVFLKVISMDPRGQWVFFKLISMKGSGYS